jgi:selenocysteine-specific elongation factor
VIVQSNLDEATARKAAQELYKAGRLVNLEEKEGDASAQLEHTNLTRGSLVSGKGYWDQLALRMVQEVESYHLSFPLRRGMPREELKSRLKLPGRLFSLALHKLVRASALEENGPWVLQPGHMIRFTPQQKHLVDMLMKRFADSPFAPPTVKDSQAEVGEDIFTALVEMGHIVLVPPDVAFRKEDYEKMMAEVRQLLEQGGTVTAAQVRDHFNTSRRYVLSFLEHLDARGITVREGDLRRLKR